MDKIPPKPRKLRGETKEKLMSLDKNELVERLIQLEAHNTQLKNIISKTITDGSPSTHYSQQKSFDFNKCHFRRVLLRIAYFGWDYQGLAVQENSAQTIEHHLFNALIKSCLIEKRETSNYHRCGRTDKGVSAFGQVISITLRSKHSPEKQAHGESLSTEIQYCKILNRLLPKEIRALAWMPIPDNLTEYSARFDCNRRIYKYYFPRSSLDLTAMRQACKLLIGSHDFRHLCKMDVGNGVVEFIRKIFSAEIVAVDDKFVDEPTSMYYLKIEGNAFLWHQIRCIMGILLLIGEGKENFDVVAELLDVEKTLRKPQYNMALDVPLNLFKCCYELEDSTDWYYDEEELKCVIEHLQNEWTLQSVKTTMIKDALQELEKEYDNKAKQNSENGGRKDRVMSYTDCLTQGVKPRVYTALLKRETCSSLEERIEYYKKKRKLDVCDEEKE